MYKKDGLLVACFLFGNLVRTRLPSQAIGLAVPVGRKKSDVSTIFYNHFHHGLTQEKFGSEEVRLAPLVPLPTIEATIHN